MLLNMSDLGQASVDQVMTQQTLSRSIDELSTDARDYKSEYSGFGAVWERLRGSPALAPINAEAAELRKKIIASGLPDASKAALTARLDKTEAMIAPADLRLLIAGGVIYLAVKGISAAASAGASVATEKAKERFSRTKLGAKLGVKAKKRKRKVAVDAAA